MHAFADLPATPRNHYTLLLHGAVARLLAVLEAGLPPGGAPAKGEGTGAFPFLDGYRRALAEAAGGGSSAAALAGWWTDAVARWERAHGGDLPLMRYGAARGLDGRRRLILMVPALVEEDARFAGLFSAVQGPEGGGWPSIQLLARALADGPAVTGVSDPWSLCRPLLESGVVRVNNPGAARASWVLRIPPLLVDALRGDLGEAPAPGLRLTPRDALPFLPELTLPEAFRTALREAAALLKAGEARSLLLRGGAGSTPVELAGALARELGLRLLAIEPEFLAQEGRDCIGPLCALAGALPLVRDAESVPNGDLPRLTLPAILSVGRDASLPGDRDSAPLSLDVPELTPSLRREVWAQHLGGVDADLETIAERFVLSAGHIPVIARSALAAARVGAGRRVGAAEVRQALTDLNRRELLAYAERLEVRGGWGDLVTGEATFARLHELYRRCRHRERLTEALGRGFGNSTNRGVRALFTGVSGTGKTLAAKILAAELGLDLYRVDLAAIVNKYIGETEKNLREVLGRAESLDLILLLDEGDALLGGRTDVRSANDRYANLQTNYLLQRLEHYQGIVLVTTNLAENIDRAFKRRMDVVVPFQPPGPEERLGILGLHLPADHRVGRGFLEEVAARCALSGGQLRNLVLHAVLLALDEGGCLENRHLFGALRSEYHKAGAAFPLTDLEPVTGVACRSSGVRDPMEAFAGALAMQRGSGP